MSPDEAEGGRNPQISDAEWQVMEELWRCSSATAREVSLALAESTGWTRSTVKTMLERLAEKGAVEVELRGNVRHFSPAIGPRTARRSALRSLVDRAFGGRWGALVQHLVSDSELSARDRAELERTIRDELAADDGPEPRGSEPEHGEAKESER